MGHVALDGEVGAKLRKVSWRRLLDDEPRERHVRLELSEATMARLSLIAGQKQASVAEVIRWLIRGSLDRFDQEAKPTGVRAESDGAAIEFDRSAGTHAVDGEHSLT